MPLYYWVSITLRISKEQLFCMYYPERTTAGIIIITIIICTTQYQSNNYVEVWHCLP